MARSKRVFSPEFREDAVKLVIDSSRPIAQVARELGIGEATLGNWVNKYRRDHAGEEAPLSVSDRARLREVERQLREVRMENEFLKKAASYFTATVPGTKMIGDITYVPTWEGWVYLATVIDCYSKKVIAYAMDDNYK